MGLNSRPLHDMPFIDEPINRQNCAMYGRKQHVETNKLLPAHTAKRVKLMIRAGNWMLTERGLFRLRWHHAVKNKTTHWQQWDRII